jgi:hypothetical protein
MIFCHKHRAILQTRADALKIRERYLMQRLQYREQNLKVFRKLTTNIFVVVGAVALVGSAGVFAGFNYPSAIACHVGDVICKLRVKSEVVPIKGN